MILLNVTLGGTPPIFNLISVRTREIMWNPTVISSVSLRCSFKISCSSRNQWRHWFSEELQSVYPSSFSSHSSSSSCLFWEEVQSPADQKPCIIENYVTLNKRNVPMRWITTMETWQVQFFSDCFTKGLIGAFNSSLFYGSVQCRPKTHTVLVQQNTKKKKHCTKVLILTEIANITSQYNNICVIIQQLLRK